MRTLVRKCAFFTVRFKVVVCKEFELEKAPSLRWLKFELELELKVITGIGTCETSKTSY